MNNAIPALSLPYSVYLEIAQEVSSLHAIPLSHSPHWHATKAQLDQVASSISPVRRSDLIKVLTTPTSGGIGYVFEFQENPKGFSNLVLPRQEAPLGLKLESHVRPLMVGLHFALGDSPRLFSDFQLYGALAMSYEGTVPTHVALAQGTTLDFMERTIQWRESIKTAVYDMRLRDMINRHPFDVEHPKKNVEKIICEQFSYLGELVQLSERDVLKIKWIGRTHLRIIKKWLERINEIYGVGLSLAMRLDNWQPPK